MKTLKTTILFFLLTLSIGATAQEITSPREFFGFEMGADRELARWDRIVEYFEYLDEQSDRIQVTDLGPQPKAIPICSRSSRRPRT